MNSLIYAGVVLGGAITLLIEANRNFNDSLKDIPFKEYSVLQNLRIEALCTPREKMLGFVFYASLYIVVYIVVLSSSELYDLTTKAARAAEEIGPGAAPVSSPNDPLGLVGAGYGRPIFVSAAIIALFSIGALKSVERTMRSLAHRLAGVPGGVYRIIEDLYSVRPEELLGGGQTQYLSLFQNNAKGKFGDDSSEQVGQIELVLRMIDSIAPAVSGKFRAQYFPIDHFEILNDSSAALESQLSLLRDEMKQPNIADNAELQLKLYNRIMSIKNDTIALFAVYYLRNNRAIKGVSKGSALESITRKVDHGYHAELNSFGMSLLFAIFFSIIVSCMTYLNWNKAEAPISETLLRVPVFEAFNRATSSEAGIENHPCGAPSIVGNIKKFDTINDKEPLAATSLDAQQTQCLNIWNSQIEQMQAKRRQTILDRSFWSVLSVSLGVALAALSTLLGRDVRLEDNSWPTWKLRRIPFIRFLATAIVPAMLAVVGVTIGSFLDVWVEANYNLTQSEIVSHFQNKDRFLILHAGLGAIIAFGVLVLADQHKNLYFEQTFLLGLLFGLATLFYYYVIVIAGYDPAFMRSKPNQDWFTFDLRETLILGSSGCLFFVFFGFFVEYTEDEHSEKGSYILKTIHAIRVKLFDPVGDGAVSDKETAP